LWQNWTAAVAFLLGFLPNVPGLAASLDSKLHPNGMQDLFKIAWLYGVCYYITPKFWVTYIFIVFLDLSSILDIVGVVPGARVIF
jgi:cytosine/uracil/thiamine/allantoin permease